MIPDGCAVEGPAATAAGLDEEGTTVGVVAMAAAGVRDGGPVENEAISSLFLKNG
jgi:hypothetical protein